MRKHRGEDRDGCQAACHRHRASSGIGRELARRFAANGFDVVVAAEDDEVAAAAESSPAAERLSSPCGPTCLPWILNISTELINFANLILS